MELTIYTDGSARNVVRPDNGSKQYCAGWGLWGYIGEDHDKCFSGYGPVYGNQTNNRGEQLGAYHALDIALRLKAKVVNIYIDSRYVLEPLRVHLDNWARRGWKTKEGDDVKNQDIWKEMLVLKQSCHKRGMRINLFKVKGHSGDKGNDLADHYAVTGAKCTVEAAENVFDFSAIEEQKPVKVEPVVEEKAEKKKPAKVPVKDPLIVGTKILCLSNVDYFYDEHPLNGETWNVTYSTKYETDKKVEDRYLGVEAETAFYCVTMHKERDFQLDAIRHHVDNIQTNSHILPVIIHWDKLSAGPIRKKHNELGTDFPFFQVTNHVCYEATQKDKKTGLEIPVDVPIARVAFHARRAWSCVEHMESMYFNLKDFLAGNTKEENIKDITETFYETTVTKKKDKEISKRSARKDLGNDYIDVEAWGNNHRLSSMIDIPALNRMGSILKVHPDVKVALIRCNVHAGGYRYLVVIHSENSACVVGNPYSNIIYTLRG